MLLAAPAYSSTNLQPGNCTYDAVGNRTQKVSTLPGYPGGLTNYNANDQLATDAYDANGNTTASGSNTGSNGYVYDFENRLIQQVGVSIVYDGDGNRVRKTAAGVTTTYLVDTLNPTGYAQVLYETAQGPGVNSDNRAYVYGLERISQQRSFFLNFQNGTQTSYYVYDGHGSVRALADPSGAATDSYDYDAFGNLIHSTGATPNNYLFAGEQYDPDLHLYYNRARYLNTATGRFWSMDTEEGDDDTPLSLHKYLYTQANPVDNVDPSGNDTLVDTIGSLSVGQTIASLAIITLTGVCASIAVVIHGPGFCGNKFEPLTLFRGLSGKNPGQIKPEYFDEDGFSLYEELLPGRYRFRLPFEIDYYAPKTAGTMAAHIWIPPFLDTIANITYTPQLGDAAIGRDHWSLQVNAVGEVLERFIQYMKQAAVPF